MPHFSWQLIGLYLIPHSSNERLLRLFPFTWRSASLSASSFPFCLERVHRSPDSASDSECDPDESESESESDAELDFEDGVSLIPSVRVYYSDVRDLPFGLFSNWRSYLDFCRVSSHFLCSQKSICYASPIYIK